MCEIHNGPPPRTNTRPRVHKERPHWVMFSIEGPAKNRLTRDLGSLTACEASARASSLNQYRPRRSTRVRLSAAKHIKLQGLPSTHQPRRGRSRRRRQLAQLSSQDRRSTSPHRTRTLTCADGRARGGLCKRVLVPKAERPPSPESAGGVVDRLLESSPPLHKLVRQPHLEWKVHRCKHLVDQRPFTKCPRGRRPLDLAREPN